MEKRIEDNTIEINPSTEQALLDINLSSLSPIKLRLIGTKTPKEILSIIKNSNKPDVIEKISRKWITNRPLIKVNGVIIPEHVYVWELNFGKVPKGYVIHHKNLDKNDNRIENLECMLNGTHVKLHNQLRKQ